jgi:hemerythrin superfamily protein
MQAEELRHDHELLHRRGADLVLRAESGDWHECDEIWDEFCRILDDHMSEEEAHVLPGYSQGGEREAAIARAITQDHAAIRAEMDRLGVAIQVHAVRAEDIRELVAHLDEHAQREEPSLYSWLVAQKKP